MIRRLSSIDWKFPLVMSGLILATAALFVWSAYVQFTTALFDETGQRLRSGATLVAPLVVSSAPARRAQHMAIADDPAVRRALRQGGSSLAVQAGRAIRATLGSAADSTRLGFQLFTADAQEVIADGLRAAEPWPAWAVGRIRADSLLAWHPVAEYSPVFDVAGKPVYQVATAVVARGDEAVADTTLGYFVETRKLVGQGQAAIRELVGAGTIIVGSPGAGVWTDLESVLSGPPPIHATDSVMVFDVSPRGPGVGVAEPIPGTPWVVWLQQPQSEAAAPARVFILRVIPVAAAIALLGALIVWLLSRQVTNRLVALTTEVDRMEAGHSGPPIVQDDVTDDEIERLENAFDRMSARVEQQQRLEAQLMQSQKIEAVGRLAGGIAHDFNNVLTVVRNYTELVRSDMPAESESVRDLDEVLRATERAAGLTRQLLAFSRQQVIAPQQVDVNDVIAGAQRMLTRVIPSNVVFEVHPDASLSHVSVDRGQLEQVLLNLTLNAVDAMPNGGRLTIRTQMAPLDERPESPLHAAEGRFVCIIVSDTGTGMDATTLSRIFEPFFTTKAVGKGTGLGLATAHGIVTQSGGHLSVQSEPGVGTTFKLYFPPVEGAHVRRRPREDATISMYAVAPPTGRAPLATVLVVEDDPATREVTRRLLERGGYRVVEAEHAGVALAKLGSNPGMMDMVLTDVMMPGMSGVDLTSRVAERWPTLPVLMMSGYSDAEVRAKGAFGRQVSLIEKPFTAAGLLSAVESTLRGE